MICCRFFLLKMSKEKKQQFFKNVLNGRGGWYSIDNFHPLITNVLNYHLQEEVYFESEQGVEFLIVGET